MASLPVKMWINQACLADGKPDPIKIDPIIMMGFNYCNLEKLIGQPYVEGKKLKMLKYKGEKK